MYFTQDVIKLFEGAEANKRKGVIYGRVSSCKQKEDLERQVNYLKELYPEYEVIKDIASGLNFERKGLNKLLEECTQGNISTVVVTHKDRLARYGCELIFWIFEKFNVEVIIHDSDPGIEGQEELSDDIISIITVFTARYYGSRSAQNKRRRKQIAQEKAKEGEAIKEEPGEGTTEVKRKTRNSKKKAEADKKDSEDISNQS